MNRRALRIALILGMILSSLAPVYTARAENPFPSPDLDADGLSNALETGGWYSLAGGPFITDPNDADSDNDGLTDGEEKLFNTNRSIRTARGWRCSTTAASRRSNTSAPPTRPICP